MQESANSVALLYVWDGSQNKTNFERFQQKIQKPLFAFKILAFPTARVTQCAPREMVQEREQEVRVHANTIKLNHYHYYNYTMC